MRIARIALALVLASLSAFMAYSYVMMPYQVVTQTVTTTHAVPSGDAYWVLALTFAVLALVAAFSGDWS